MSCELTPDLLTTHTPPAKDPTLNCYSSVPLGRASFADRSRNCIKHLHKADLKNNVLIVMLILTRKLKKFPCDKLLKQEATTHSEEDSLPFL